MNREQFLTRKTNPTYLTSQFISNWFTHDNFTFYWTAKFSTSCAGQNYPNMSLQVFWEAYTEMGLDVQEIYQKKFLSGIKGKERAERTLRPKCRFDTFVKREGRIEYWRPSAHTTVLRKSQVDGKILGKYCSVQDNCTGQK